jgi:hypothetical protein
VASLLESVSLLVLYNCDNISHFTTIANIYQTFEGFSWTQTEILLPKGNPRVAGDALVMKVFFIDFPGHSLFHCSKNILQASLIKLILLFVLKLVEY